MKPSAILIPLSAAGLLLSTAFATVRPAPDKLETALSRDAAALLSARCVKCHDAEKHSGGIDLTTRTAAQASGVFGAGVPEKTRIVRAVSEGRMPPTGKMASEEIGLLRKWVASGAVYAAPKLVAETPLSPTLWSFQPIQQPSIPVTKFDALAANPIDRFVFAKLAEKGLRPSAPADRLTLLRRVSIDLTGLPPTPEEVSTFLADKSPNAYEKVVDRLLASPAYGERWGRHWLDVVRYGESNGYEQNHLRTNAWPYRDYVVRAFNEDKSFARFITEQLAGDVVGKGDPAVEAATGFLVAGVHDTVGIQTEEGTRQQRADDLDDIVSTTGAAFLGLTVGCAKCHDHKFDPIPQRDFYRLAAVFAGVRHGERQLPTRVLTSAEVAEATDVERRLASDANEINEIEGKAREVVLRSRGQEKASRPAVNARRNEDGFAPVMTRFVRFTVLATKDGSEPCIDELQVFSPESKENLALASAGAKASASSLLPGFTEHSIPHLIDGKLGNEFSWISSTRGTGWAQVELPNVVRVNRVVWSRDGGEIPRFDDRIPNSYRIEVSLDGKAWQTVSTEAGRAGSSDYIHPDLLTKAMSEEQRARRSLLAAEVTRLKARASELSGKTSAYIGQFNAPDSMFVLRRGDVMQRTDPVLPGALSLIKTVKSDLVTDAKSPEPERRLALAQWLSNSNNPLTARVIVNRMWQHHFGRGIVGTPSDFGRNGEKPTHPELLDWLANDFMSHDWRMKRLHKMMVMSATYRQANAANPAGMAKDAGNLLLWRMPLQRMEAEAVRDAILLTSGKLDRRMGGPSFRLFKYNVVNVAIYEPLEEFAPETWRRSVYQQAARAIKDDLLATFDCPESAQRAPRRDSTTTALQALSLLNGPFIVQQSNAFAERIKKDAGETSGLQIQRAFTLAFGRPPRAEEKTAAEALIKADGLAALCRALMNANEFLYY
jgi:cytochrome c553